MDRRLGCTYSLLSGLSGLEHRGHPSVGFGKGVKSCEAESHKVLNPDYAVPSRPPPGIREVMAGWEEPGPAMVYTASLAPPGAPPGITSTDKPCLPSHPEGWKSQGQPCQSTASVVPPGTWF